jgi:hypothetical protein
MPDLPRCKLCQCAPNVNHNGVYHPTNDSPYCPLRKSGFMTRAQWNALMGVDRDSARYQWLRDPDNFPPDDGTAPDVWDKPSHWDELCDLHLDDFDNWIDAAMGEQQ